MTSALRSTTTIKAIVLAATLGALASPAYAVSLEWVKQLPDSRIEGFSTDDLGNVYLAGYLSDAVQPEASGQFVAKYDASGSPQWFRKIETSSYTGIRGVSAEAPGYVYVTGETLGLPGSPPLTKNDAFLAQYDAAGNFQWSRQLGTSVEDGARAVSADSLGNVYITGLTFGSLGGPAGGEGDPFLAKYDVAGNLLWTRQLTSAYGAGPYGVSADELGNVYISGSTWGNLGGLNAGSLDAFVTKYDGAGNRLWTRQLGTTSVDESLGVSADKLGNVFISGYTWGSLSASQRGDGDAFVAKYDASGVRKWTRQLGSSRREESHGVSADGLGNVYIAGFTYGSLGGSNAGDSDVFVSKYNDVGVLQWSKQLGSSAQDGTTSSAAVVSVDGLGAAYVWGVTAGNLGGAGAGSPFEYDAFIAKYSDAVPEPSAPSLCVAVVAVAARRWRTR